jgi:hypothetical protein
MLKVALSPRISPRYLWLKELTGRQEFALAEGHPQSLAEALSSLVVSMSPTQFQSLTLSDRDRLLATVFTHCFGDTVESIVKCTGCGKPFELGFSLSELSRELEEPLEEAQGVLTRADDQGVFTLGDTLRFRLPTVRDEVEAAGLPEDGAARFLIERCLVAGSVEHDLPRVEAELERLAPLMRTELTSECPHCGTAHRIDFDLVSYAERCFKRDLTMLTREIHCLASAYRFSYNEILDMPRSVRQNLTQLLLGHTRTSAGLA